MKKCYQIHLADNVAVLLQDAALESVEIIGGTRSIGGPTTGSSPSTAKAG